MNKYKKILSRIVQIIIIAAIALSMSEVIYFQEKIFQYRLPDWLATLVLIISSVLLLVRLNKEELWQKLHPWIVRCSGTVVTLLLFLAIISSLADHVKFFFSEYQFSLLLLTWSFVFFYFGYMTRAWKTVLVGAIIQSLLLYYLAGLDTVFEQNQWYLLVFIFMVLGVGPLIVQSKIDIDVSKKIFSRKFIFVGLAALTITAFWLRFTHLGDASLYHDEVHIFASAYSYLQTGQFTKWDFALDQLGKPYIRSFDYAWLIAQSFKLFGVSEFAARLPIALTGVLSIPFFYLLYRFFSQQRIALIATILSVFFLPFVLYSRFIRGYSILFIEYLVLLYLGYRIVESIIQWNEKKEVQFKKILLLVLIWCAVFLLAFLNQPVIAMVIPVLVSYVVLMTVFDIYKKRTVKVPGTLIILGAIILSEVALVGYKIVSIQTGWVDPSLETIIQGGFVTFLANPHWEYLEFVFDLPYRSGILAGFAAIIGMILIVQMNYKKGLLLSLAWLVPLFSAIFVWERYVDERYTSFVHPVLLLGVAAGIEYTAISISRCMKEKKSRSVVTILGIVSGMLIIVPPSFPGLTLEPITTTAVADWETVDAEQYSRRQVAPLFKEAYGLINHEAAVGDIIITTSDPHGSLWYLDNPQQYAIYGLRREDETIFPMTDKAAFPINFFDLIYNVDRPTVWIISEYVHLTPKRIFEYLKQQAGTAHEHGDEVEGAFIYNYNDFYKNKFYWPSVYQIPPVNATNK